MGLTDRHRWAEYGLGLRNPGNTPGGDIRRSIAHFCTQDCAAPGKSPLE